MGIKMWIAEPGSRIPEPHESPGDVPGWTCLSDAPYRVENVDTGPSLRIEQDYMSREALREWFRREMAEGQ